MGGAVGDDARQVRRAALRRRAHARAELVGSANTLVRTDDRLARRQHRRRRRDGRARRGCRQAAGRAAVLGAGGTAPAAVVALAELGVRDVSWSPAIRTRPPAARVCRGSASTRDGSNWHDVAGLDVVVSTLPADIAAGTRAGRRGACAARRDLRSVAYTAGRRGRRRRRRVDQRAADAAAPGVRASRAIHRAACAERGDDRGAGSR